MTTPPAEWIATDLDLRWNELLNARAQNAPANEPPADPVKGQLWFDTTSNSLKYWDGTAWAGGRTYYNTLADDGVARTQRSKMNFRSTGSMAATVTDDAPNDTSAVTLDAKFGAVTSSVVPGAAAADGTASTVARSDHSHGTPTEGGADVSFTSWWQYSRELWEQLSAPATFVDELPGQTVGGGWQVGTNGSIYWNGDPIPISGVSLYRNSARVSALGDSAVMSMGWLCYDVDHELLGQVQCSNQVPIVPANEFDVLVARNLVPNPGGEAGAPDNTGAATGQWYSVNDGGTTARSIVAYATDKFYTGLQSIRATWQNLGTPSTRSNCVIHCPTPVPPGTPVTLSAQVYVPAGSPDVRLHYAEDGIESSLVTEKNDWVYVEVPWTTPDDGVDHDFVVGIYTSTPAHGTTAYLDNVMLRVGHDPLPEGRTYFDGDTVPIEDETFAWDGEPHNSTSSYYTVEPDWKAVVGYVASGEGVAPVTGTSTDVDEAVTPLPGTLYFRPFVSCTGGQMLVDTHEVIRSPRELRVVDGLETGWLTSNGPITAPKIVTLDISPPDTDPVVPLQIGPVKDPPDQAGDVVSRSYVDRMLGLLPEETAAPPQFLWSGDPGVDPQPADLGFPFAAWPLFSQWMDTSVKQSKITVLMGTYAGTASQATPLLGSGVWGVPPNCYQVVTTVPADGVLVCVSNGNVNAAYADYVLLRCAAYSGVNESGVGGTYVGSASQNAASSSDSTIARLPYTLFSIVAVTAGTRYMFRTEYGHGGGTSGINRDQCFGVYLPHAVQMGAA